MIKIRETATPIKTDGGAKLGALTGAIVGAILAYGGLALAVTHPAGTTATISVMAGLIIGLAIGSAVGALIDLRLTPKVKPGETPDDHERR